MKTPDQEVSDRIIQEFRKKKLFSEKDILKIGPLLAQGKVQAEDWRLFFEIDQMEKEANNAGKSQ